MQTLKQLREIKFKVSSTDLYFSKIKDLPRRKIDMDVWLPSKNKNLQRGNVWTLEQKQQLVMSIFYERYIPNICVASIIDGNGTHPSDDLLQIIDGKQRLTAMMEFYQNVFIIDIEGQNYYFKDLPIDYKNAFAWYDIKCQMAYDDFDKKLTDQDKIDWFMRINYFGTPQEIEHLKSLL